jgi:D-alanine-D-alanine ligase
VSTRLPIDALRGALGRVGVLMGGDSAEREVSLRSGRAVVAALTETGVDVVPIDWSGRIDEGLMQVEVDRYFIALHGRGGEDGQMQALLSLLGKPYTGSGVAACALAMDKIKSKLVWRGAGLPTPDFRVVSKDCEPRAVFAELGDTVFVKPACEGSSLGVSKVVRSSEALMAAIERALHYDAVVLAERAVIGGEFTASILNGRALPLIKLETSREFYDFEAKYAADDTRYLCPCGLDPATERAAAEVCMRAFDAIGASGWGRVDFMLCPQSGVQLIELNTVPGLTDHSLVPMAATKIGLSLSELVMAILEQTLLDGKSL